MKNETKFTLDSDWLCLHLEENGDVSVQLPPKREWIQWIRKVPGRTWDADRKRWLMSGDHETVSVFCYYFKNIPVQIMDNRLLHQYPELLKLKNKYELQSIVKLKDMMKRKKPHESSSHGNYQTALLSLGRK